MSVKDGMGARLRKYGLIVSGVAGVLILLDVIGFIATVYFSTELLRAAEAAGLAGLLQR